MVGEAREPVGVWMLLRRVCVRALLPICIALVALSLPYNITGDGAERFAALDLLLRHGVLSPDRYSLIGPLFSTPLYLIGAALGFAEGGVALFNVTLFLLGLLASHLMLRRHMEPGALRRFELLLLTASMFPVAISTYYGEAFTAIMVAVGFPAALLTERRGTRIAGWVAVVFGVANTPATLPALALATAVIIWRSGRWRYALAVAGAAALIAGESLLRRGSLFATVYASDGGLNTIAPLSNLRGFSYPIILGLLAIFLSFGKGLIFYAPGLFLPLRARLRALGASGAALIEVYGAWLTFLAGLILVYAAWWGWAGDWFWGPRFLLFASVPASFALAYWTQRPAPRLALNLLALLALALSVWVGIDGAVFRQGDMAICRANDFRLLPICQFLPDYSALWRPFFNLGQYGLSARFLQVEQTDPRWPLFAVCAPVAGLYVAAPLLRAIAGQTRALVANRWARREELLVGWRW